MQGWGAAHLTEIWEGHHTAVALAAPFESLTGIQGHLQGQEKLVVTWVFDFLFSMHYRIKQKLMVRATCTCSHCHPALNELSSVNNKANQQENLPQLPRAPAVSLALPVLHKSTLPSSSCPRPGATEPLHMLCPPLGCPPFPNPDLNYRSSGQRLFKVTMVITEYWD